MLHRLLSILLLVAASPAVAQSTDDATLLDFERPPAFAFGTFQDKATVDGGVLHLAAPKGQGGFGYTHPRPFTGFDDASPVLRLRLGKNHKAKTLILSLKDAGDHERKFEYDLSDLPVGEAVDVYPEGVLAFTPAAMGNPDDPFDPSEIKNRLVMGNWQQDPYDLYIESIVLKTPPADLMQERKEAVAKIEAERQKELEKQQKLAAERERILSEGADHPADGPEITEVSTLGPTILAIYIEERQIERRGQFPYQPQEGDLLKEGGKKTLAWKDGEAALLPTSTTVMRPVEPGSNRRKQLGELVYSEGVITQNETITGQTLTTETVAEPRAYALHSDSDAAYAQPTQPVKVHHKAKPFGRSDNGNAGRHWVYLELPEPMQPGVDYTLDLTGVNTAEPSVTFTYDSTELRSPAVQVSHVGYRPSDPFKRAFLSQWLGTGGAYAFDDAKRFELLDESGEVVYEGEVERILAADEKENLTGNKNYTGTNVYGLDFGGFTDPGVYRVHVPGVGVSYPFPIADGVWEQAFGHVMKGLLAHRSGIDLPKDLIGFERPRPMHPDDGFTVLQADVARWDGESKAIEASLTRLLGPDLDTSKIEKVDNAWGGYQDAGDWDRRATHLDLTYELLELYAMFPDFFREQALTLPADEASNAIPDLLDEALWGVELYQRLQTDDGGVRGGIEQTAHPAFSQTSWQETLLAAAFLPDPEASYLFAANAAKLSGLLEPFDPDRAEALGRDAERAYDWAQANTESSIEAAKARKVKNAEKLAGAVRDKEALAAVELYRLTGERSYHDAFVEASGIDPDKGGDLPLDATMAYASLPDDLQEPALAERAKQYVVSQGDAALAFGQGNAYGISHRVKGLPFMGWVAYYSTPEAVVGPTLPRAHYLTGDDKYLEAALRATNYAVGANPSNMTMTTGLGQDYPRFPLHVDSRNSGQEPPPGIVVYGPHDPTRAPGYVKQFALKNNLVPDVADWPAAESYTDIGNWVEMNEYTVTQTIGPTAYYWGYLAARPDR